MDNMTINWMGNMTFMTDKPPPRIHPNMPQIRFVCEVLISLPLAILGIIGNILAFVVLCRQKQRLTTNVLLQALAVADTLVLLSTILVRSLRYVGWDTYNTDIHPYIFVVLYPCVYFFRLADTWLTVMLTIDRYIAVCHPLHAQRICTTKRTYISIAVIVVATFLFSMPRFFEYRLVPHGTRMGFSPTILVTSPTYSMAYSISLFFLAMYLVPMILLIVLNILLLCALRRAYSTRDTMVINGNIHSAKKEKFGMTANRGVSIMVATVVIVCVICNVSAMITHALWSLQYTLPELEFLAYYHRIPANISNILITFNCAINFVIYCMFSRKFRQGVSQACSCNGARVVRLKGRRHSDYRNESSTAANTSSTSLGLIPLRFSIRSNKKVVRNKSIDI